VFYTAEIGFGGEPLPYLMDPDGALESVRQRAARS
jgi:hypothetical protein